MTWGQSLRPDSLIMPESMSRLRPRRLATADWPLEKNTSYSGSSVLMDVPGGEDQAVGADDDAAADADAVKDRDAGVRVVGCNALDRSLNFFKLLN